jgi:hypothetical protein
MGNLGSTYPAGRCERCGRRATICVCARVQALACRRTVLVLQHPQEVDFELGSAGLVVQSLGGARLSTGLSWPSLAVALGEEVVSPGQWAVIFPDNKLESSAARAVAGVRFALANRRGGKVDGSAIRGIVALDGSWSQAKSLWWRNPWLLKLCRLTLFPSEPSIYGRLRREPRPQYLSTLEAVADALVACGEPLEVRDGLRRLFRTMLQRARDAQAKTK